MFENDNVYAYGSVKRWAKKVVGGNVFALNKLVVPVNISNSHWCLCVAHVQVSTQGVELASPFWHAARRNSTSLCWCSKVTP